MHQDKKEFHAMVARHLFILVLAVVFLAGMGLYFGPAASSTSQAGGVLIFLALFVFVIFLLRDRLMSTLQQMHGGSSAENHGHSGQVQETRGTTIRWAWFYDAFVNGLLAGQERQLREATVALAQIQPGEKVLDVGCGTGSLALVARKNSGVGVEISGVDAAVEMIERARQKADRAGLDVKFETGVVEALDFKDDSFDLLFNSLVVHHLPADLKKKAFAEMLRVLKPGGRLVLVEFEPPKSGIRKLFFSFLLGGMMKIDNSGLESTVARAGFEIRDKRLIGGGFGLCIRAFKPVVPNE
jgi:demethylmenaquinone methyltransferase/2-methoxy-6-polyprenyl-1,4-benzoquinol methylase/phosphoethanolamine N-methyltransferase